MGASKPEDYGLYFQWGDTKGYTKDQVGEGDGKKKFTLKDYKWNDSGLDYNANFTKYTTTGATLKLEDDAAHANMGGGWHMPSPTQFQELINNTTTAWTTSDGVSGMTFTSKNDTSKSIFIPAADYASYGSVKDSGGFTKIWSSMLDNQSAFLFGATLYLASYGAGISNASREYGLTVRGVIGQIK